MLLCRKFTCLSILLAIVSSVVTGCGSKADSTGAPTAKVESKKNESENNNGGSSNVRYTPSTGNSEVVSRGGAFIDTPSEPIVVEMNPVVMVKTSHGNIKIELDAENAPTTVENFLKNYVDRDFYSQTIFHYVDKEMFIAGGGYTSDLRGKPTQEEIINEAYNGLKNIRGSVAMARHPQSAKSATSQFLINLGDNSALLDHRGDKLEENYDENYGYCVFGRVIEGMEVVDRIAESRVGNRGDFQNLPVQPVVIESIQKIK